MPVDDELNVRARLPELLERPYSIAYFSMEMAFADELPTFSGGLGVLAADFLRSAADAALPLVGVTLAYRNGYFRQHLGEDGRQYEAPVSWSPADQLERLSTEVVIELANREVHIGAWLYCLRGVSGAQLPIIYLDTDLESNDERDRAITDQLYGGDHKHRLEQEAVLGLGGLAMLRALGLSVETHHLNEGHASLLMLGLLEERIETGSSPSAADLAAVRSKGVFTTHTPVPAGHDVFAADEVYGTLGQRHGAVLDAAGFLARGQLNMTELGMGLSRYVNGVSRRHGAVTRAMFPGVKIDAITNGVHVGSWVAPAMAELFDQHMTRWREENVALRYALEIDAKEIVEAHNRSKRALFEHVSGRTGVSLDPEVFTIGIARRATPYKQTTLLFSDLDRLREIVTRSGPLQIVSAGKAHPHDEAGKQLIAQLITASRELSGEIAVVFLEDYNLSLAKLMCSGSDVWLNTPIKPHEASGTSGMKAAVNGTPNLSVLDGWWIEGCVENVTGWAIGDEDSQDDAPALYNKLGSVVLPQYYGDHEHFAEVMRSSIALVGSFFNTERMLAQYRVEAYRA